MFKSTIGITLFLSCSDRCGAAGIRHTEHLSLLAGPSDSPTGAFLNSTGSTGSMGSTGATGSTGSSSPHMCTFDDTIHVEQGDTCGQCLCETTHMEEQSEHDLQHLLDRAEEYCLQQLRLLDGLHPDQPPTWGNGSPSQGAVNREQQEQEHMIETGAIMTLLEIENDGPTGTTGRRIAIVGY